MATGWSGFGGAVAPLATLFGFGVQARDALYTRGLLRVQRAGRPVISVGGLEVGGSGKTPVTGYLLARLQGYGLRPGLVSRGYGRLGHELRVRQRGAAAVAIEIGDEPAMLVQAGLDVAVAVHPRRARAAAALVAEGADVLVLDDGFAHRALARDLDIVVLRGAAPFGRGGLLPQGTLREPPTALRRAHIVWLHHAGADWELPSAELQAWAPQAAWVVSHARTAAPCGRGPSAPGGVRSVPGVVNSAPGGVRSMPGVVNSVPGDARTVPGGATSVPGDARSVPGGANSVPGGANDAAPASLAGVPVLGAAGIARPDAFAATLAHTGAVVRGFVPYADHHRFTVRDVQDLVARRDACGAVAVVVTAKDYVKLAPLWPDARLWQLPQCLELVAGAAALEAALRRVLRVTA